MKCLVFSDSHGNAYYIERVLSMHRDAEAVFFLGDGLCDIEPLRAKYKNAAWLYVRGNCDPVHGAISDAGSFGSITLFGKKILFTHGDRIGVKYDIESAFSYAADNGADILLFGHTHKPYEGYREGIYLFNPGSISAKYGEHASFGVMNISDAGVLFSHGELL